MASVSLCPAIGAAWQSFLANGATNALGTVTTYQAGSSTPVATYTSSAGSVTNPTTITLSASGTLPSEVWIVQGTTIKIVVADVNSNILGTFDNIPGVNDVSIVAALASPHLTGVPTAPTNGTATDSSTQIATDAFVQNAIAAAASGGIRYTSVVSESSNPTTLTVSDSGKLFFPDTSLFNTTLLFNLPQLSTMTSGQLIGFYNCSQRNVTIALKAYAGDAVFVGNNTYGGSEKYALGAGQFATIVASAAGWRVLNQNIAQGISRIYSLSNGPNYVAGVATLDLSFLGQTIIYTGSSGSARIILPDLSAFASGTPANTLVGQTVEIINVGTVSLIVQASAATATSYIRHGVGQVQTTTVIVPAGGHAEFMCDSNGGGSNSTWEMTGVGFTSPYGSFGAVAWAKFDGTLAGTNAPTAGFNVTSIQRTGTGSYTVTLAPSTGLASANFAVCPMAHGGQLVASVGSKTLGPPTTFTLSSYSIVGAATDAQCDFAVFGF